MTAFLFGWFGVVYVAFVASGALPSDARPGRRKPGRVLADRAAFFAAVIAAPALAGGAGAVWPATALKVGRPGEWALAASALSAIAFAVGALARKSKADVLSYPQYLPARRGASALALEIGSWALYLFAYEYAFRGYLLSALMPLGAVAASSVTTALYAVAHLPKSSKEAIGALAFGAVACLLAVRFDSFLPAFFVHLALALGNDYGCARELARQDPADPGAAK